MVKLGVNIDHVATLRQARLEFDPDPVLAARVCEGAGADSIVAHLREDRRHIQDRDIILLRKTVRTKLNLEMSLDAGVVQMALAVKPNQATLVPERRQELTTEGGLDVVRQFKKVEKVSQALAGKGIAVSLFIAADKKQIEASAKAGVKIIELHTGPYARAFTHRGAAKELAKIKAMIAYAGQLGLMVNAGHGLNYDNTRAIVAIEGLEELNIGHAIVAKAVFVGLKQAVRQMKGILK